MADIHDTSLKFNSDSDVFWYVAKCKTRLPERESECKDSLSTDSYYSILSTAWLAWNISLSQHVADVTIMQKFLFFISFNLLNILNV